MRNPVRLFISFVAIFCAFILVLLPASAWEHWGGDRGGSRFSPLDQVTPGNVGNLVPPYQPDSAYHGVSAALEFGVGALKVKHIVVLGHAHCGGVQAFAEDAAPIFPGDFIGRWMTLMAPSAKKVGPRGDRTRAEYITLLEQASVANSLDNLMTFPRLRKLVDEGALTLHGAYFGVATGELSVLDRATREFKPAKAR